MVFLLSQGRSTDFSLCSKVATPMAMPWVKGQLELSPSQCIPCTQWLVSVSSVCSVVLFNPCFLCTPWFKSVVQRTLPISFLMNGLNTIINKPAPAVK